jgi:hypothetical protein
MTLVGIGLFDLVSTLMLMSRGYAWEANPLFAWLASHGSFPFAIAKVAFLAIPILILEYARERSPKSAEQGTWLAVVCYALFYLSHLLTG